MLGTTARQRVLAAMVLTIGVLTTVVALLDWVHLGLVGLSALLTLAVVLLLSIRTRLAAIDKRIRTHTSAHRTASEEEIRGRLAESEQELTEAKRENERLDDLESASYRQSLRQHIRVTRAEHRLKSRNLSPALQLPFKLRNLEFASSHGIRVPDIYGVWPDLRSIDLSTVPEKFVLKADGGAGSVAVFPLKRLDGHRYQVMGGRNEYSEDELRAHILSLGRRARSPFFAEELLHAPGGGPIPDDVKFYMFYGEVGHILVRKVSEHGRASTIRVKFVDERGHDYGPVAVGRTHDAEIQVPESLSEMTRVARHLSRAIGLPFCRVDLYESSHGIVLGEITRAPSGGNEKFVEPHDEFLGRRWIEGSARLDADLISGRPPGVLFGTQADLHLYPPSDRRRSPANFSRTVLDCSQWCHPAPSERTAATTGAG